MKLTVANSFLIKTTNIVYKNWKQVNMQMVLIYLSCMLEKKLFSLVLIFFFVNLK